LKNCPRINIAVGDSSHTIATSLNATTTQSRTLQQHIQNKKQLFKRHDNVISNIIINATNGLTKDLLEKLKNAQIEKENARKAIESLEVALHIIEPKSINIGTLNGVSNEKGTLSNLSNENGPLVNNTSVANKIIRRTCNSSRTCNNPYPVSYLFKNNQKRYIVKQTIVKPNQPKTENMQFIFTNLKSKFVAPRLYKNESEHAVSIIKYSNEAVVLLFWDGKNAWVSTPFKTQKDFRLALTSAAKTLKINKKNKTNGANVAQEKVVLLNNEHGVEKITKTTVYKLCDMIQLIDCINKRFKKCNEDEVRNAITAYKANKKSAKLESALVDVLTRYDGDIKSPTLWGGYAITKITKQVNRKANPVPTNMLRYLKDAQLHYKPAIANRSYFFLYE